TEKLILCLTILYSINIYCSLVLMLLNPVYDDSILVENSKIIFNIVEEKTDSVL
ncbi:uncharacterized protein FOMMEDRAFT_71844, partial [Fomitiporia mediterranea MF3/22]|uniref:uncharacterized protein n=1 Tax=Fomitiporia mediterranea (strain MF3/22) TaxID=694068 RepID=UPI0004407C54